VSFDPATRARLVGLFVAEADETVVALRGLEGAIAADDGALEEFGRIAHGLKGAAAALGFGGLADTMHALEDLALGIRGEPADAAAARRARLREVLELLGEGVARMTASGGDAFPGDLLEVIAPLVGLGSAAEDPPVPVPAPKVGEAPAPTPAAPPAPRPAEAVVERISVPAAEVDEALRLASSLARTAGQLHEALLAAGASQAAAAQGLAASAAGLEGIVASLRLLPAEVALSGLEEEVRELAASLGKRVTVAVGGREVRADRRTLQSARGMIRHLVRNAVDHGIEAPAARVAAGKPDAGRLAISLEAAEATLRVVVLDDGAGFDAVRIRAELARRGADPARLASSSDAEVLQVWAHEGGSTRASATQVSGRGLGLSAVAQLARAAGGGLEVRSAPGEGSTVTFTLPLEVYAVEALVVTAGGRLFGLPLRAVERTVHLAAARGTVHEGPAGRTLAVGETILPLVPLARALGLEARADRARFAVVVRGESGAAALAVDDVGAVAGLVPAAVAGLADHDALVTGLARLSDGSPVALLAPRVVLVRARAARGAGEADAPARAERPARALEVVLAEDSLATREVLRVLLEEQGFRVRLAADGEEALARIAEHVPDVLVSDVNMPRRDGIALTRALRGAAGTARLPVVLLTSQDDEAVRRAGREAGADAYLLKSRFDAHLLQETLGQLGVRAR
jgi:two-component system chemotaxis sensor kinase CheA